MATRGTLWELYLAEGNRPVAPLAHALLSDANVALLTRVLQQKAALKLGALAPAPQDLTLTNCDAFATALMEGARALGYLALTDSTLLSANRHILGGAMFRLTTEQSTWARQKEFAEDGIQLEPRPESDTERGDRKESMRPALGHGLYTPWDAYAEERGLIDHFRPFNGLTPRDVTDSDDMRIRVVPWAAPAVHGRIDYE